MVKTRCVNTELGWESIKTRSDILGLNIIHKIHKKETRPLIWTCMPKNDLGNMSLRSKSNLPFPKPAVGFLSLFPTHIKVVEFFRY